MPPNEGFPAQSPPPGAERYMEHAREDVEIGAQFKENAKTFDEAMVLTERHVTALERMLGGTGFSASALSGKVREATEAMRKAASIYSDVYHGLPRGNDGWDLIDRVEKLRARVATINAELNARDLYGIEVEMKIGPRRK